MATYNNDESKGCTFQWKIENASQCWWFEEGQEIKSPTFIADALKNTKWSLFLYLKGEDYNNCLGLYLNREKDCSGPDFIEINYQLAILGNDGSILAEETLEHCFRKNENCGLAELETQVNVFWTENEKFLPEDTLTVQCKLWKRVENLATSNFLYGRTTLKVNRKYYVWRINGSTRESVLRKKFNDTLFDFDLVLNEQFGRLDMDMISFDGCVEYISFNISITSLEGKKENCGIENYFVSDLQEGVLSPVMVFPKTWTEREIRNLPNDTLSLDIEFVFSTVKNFGCGEDGADLECDVVKRNECQIGEEKPQQTAALINDFKSLYEDGIFSDTELRTSKKSFPVHKNILSARSPVFRRMFSNDMKEVNSGHVDITDLDDDTVQRLLLYIYTDRVDDLQFEIASKLYSAADKYEILDLKGRCSTFLKENLCSTNVCDLLILADQHQDDNLKNSAQTYILDHNAVFSSLEWEHFMDNNIKLAADLMYKKLNPSKVYKKGNV